MNTKICRHCGKEISKNTKKCPECGKYCYNIPQWLAGINGEFKKRNKEIVRLLETGTQTLNTVGERFGISRERVRQIYRKVRKKPYTENLKTIRRVREKQKQKEHDHWLQTIRFHCPLCGNAVTWGEASNKKQRLCNTCKKIHKRINRSLDTINTCKNCGKDFHPYANSKGMRFCLNTCYFSYRSSHPEEFARWKKRNVQRVFEIPRPTVAVVFRINGKVISS